MKVQNMTGRTGKNVANQFIITDEGHGNLGNFSKREAFQSYNRTIAVITIWPDVTEIQLDRIYWDYSVTTGKYRNQFLGETKKETEKKIKDGIYKLVDLNA